MTTTPWLPDGMKPTKDEGLKLEFAAFVEKYSIEKVPLNEEKWRPLLNVMWRVSQKSDGAAAMIGFEVGADVQDKIRIGLLFPSGALYLIQSLMDQEMRADADMTALGKAEGRVNMELDMGPDAVVLYNRELWVPAAAIGARRN